MRPLESAEVPRGLPCKSGKDPVGIQLRVLVGPELVFAPWDLWVPAHFFHLVEWFPNGPQGAFKAYLCYFCEGSFILLA